MSTPSDEEEDVPEEEKYDPKNPDSYICYHCRKVNPSPRRAHPDYLDADMDNRYPIVCLPCYDALFE